MANHQKQWVLTVTRVQCTSFNHPKSQIILKWDNFLHNVKCLCMLYQTPASSCPSATHPLSCPSPFMHQATQVDRSLLVCAVEDSWTSSFLYKSPLEPDSGDSDLITASNKRYQHHLCSGFIFSFSRYSIAPFATQPNRRRSYCTEAEVLQSLYVFTAGFRLG